MFIFWAILVLILVLLILFAMLVLSTIQIEIKNLNFDSSKPKSKRLEEYLFIIKLKLFNKITWIKLKINKINKAKNSTFYKKVILNKIRKINETQSFKISDIKALNELKIKTDKLNLYIKFDTKETTVTAFLTAIISTLISIVLSRTTTKYEKEKYRYKVEPVFCTQNLFKICIDCIISLKMVHIINVIYILKKKRSVNKYDKRTSNRRTYAYNNE